MIADVILAERAAWKRLRAYITEHRPHAKAFRGDEASRELYREWRAARAEREKHFSVGWGVPNRRNR